MKSVCLCACTLMAFVAAAVTATKEYVDRRAEEVSAAVSTKAEKSEVRAVSNDLAAVASSVSTMWWQVYGDTVWMAVTNYLRTTDAKPSMGLWEARDGSTNCVWSSAEEIAAKTDALRVELTNSVAAAQSSADAAKSWGKFQSADGSAAVDGFTTVSTPYLMLTGGGKWEQRTVEGGSYWLFCGDATLGGDGEAFRMMDSDGNTVFEVTQGATREVAAIPTSFKVESASHVNAYIVEFGVRATSQPVLYGTDRLGGTWDVLQNITWTNQGGTNYVAERYEYGRPATMFYKAVYETGSESIVKFHRPLSFPKIEIGGTNYTVSVGTMSDGTKFLKLE